MKQHGILSKLKPFLVGVAPVVAYYGLRSVGVGDVPALLAGGSVAAADALISLAIARRLRPLPICICGMFVLTGGLAFATDDARVLLLKASVVSAAIGFYLLAITARPRLLGSVLERLVARGAAERAARWKHAWDEQAWVRRRIRVASMLAGLAMLAEAAARTLIVFHFAVGQSIILAHGPAVILIAAVVLIARFLVRPAVAGAMADRVSDDAHRARSG